VDKQLKSKMVMCDVLSPCAVLLPTLQRARTGKRIRRRR
jgi:hypothetical protein